MMKEMVVSYDSAIQAGERPRKYSGRAVCPKHNSCEFGDCPHIKTHWRGTHCNRDRRDSCPTCDILPGDYVKKRREYNIAENN